MKEEKQGFNSQVGSVQVIEMTLIFPIVLFVMGFLIYLGSYIMQSVIIYNEAQRVAVAASREAAYPGYQNLYNEYGFTTRADFNIREGAAPTISVINTIMKENHKPYRYWGNSFLSQSKKNDLEIQLRNLINSSSFLAPSHIDCTISTRNNILSQQINVHVVKRIKTPGLMRYLGLDDRIDIDVTAVAVVGNPSEFVRNIDMTFDLVEYIFDNLKIGKSNQTVNEKISIFKQKFSDAKSKLNIGG